MHSMMTSASRSFAKAGTLTYIKETLMTVITQSWTIDTTPVRVNVILRTLNRTQVQLSNLLGITPATVNRWMNSRTIPDKRSRAMLEKLERTYIDTDE
jgi:DNA-binding transcriptional regulator YiaG